MSHFELLVALKNELDGAVRAGDLIGALFADYPDLQSFEVAITSEYDDNNYSDYCRLVKVNGWMVTSDGDFDDFDEQESVLPRPARESIEAAMNIAPDVREEWGFGDHTFDRADYESRRTTEEILGGPNLTASMSIVRGEAVPVETLKRCSNKWILHHAVVHGRYSEDDEFLLFAREGMMWAANRYARKHGPLHDKTLNYWVLSLKAGDDEYETLQEYLEWLKARAA